MALFDTQHVVEVLASSTAPTSLQQAVVEVLADSNAPTSVQQVVVEVLLDPGPTNVELHQIVIELLAEVPPSVSGDPHHFGLTDRNTALDRLVTPYHRTNSLYRLYNPYLNRNRRDDD